MKGTINPGRLICCSAFGQTLANLKGKQNISEIEFRDHWLRQITTEAQMTRDGWYNPPPFGMAVLFALDEDYARIDFRSLRDSHNFPSNRTIDWDTGIMYPYALN